MSAAAKPRMRNPFASGSPESFFWTHAGWSYHPATQTPQQGRADCARRLVAAERAASDAGYSFEWSVDPDCDSSEFTGSKRNAWALWQCLARDESGEIVGCLGGVDFGRDGEPWGDPYRRVCEAEIACEALEA